MAGCAQHEQIDANPTPGRKSHLMPSQLVAGGPRVLLRRLREIMAERGSAQARLDKLVSVIAANMVAEVCSIYLRRSGGDLELFATEGLNREAVHRTRLKRGEGLVGLVADSATPLNLSNAPEHPPTTSEAPTIPPQLPLRECKFLLRFPAPKQLPHPGLGQCSVPPRTTPPVPVSPAALKLRKRRSQMKNDRESCALREA